MHLATSRRAAKITSWARRTGSPVLAWSSARTSRNTWASSAARVIELQLHQEAVHLRLGQGVFLLDGFWVASTMNRPGIG
jgi:hypothetical protein